VRERAFGWYVAYLACAIGWISTKRGVAFAWIWPDHPNWNPYASPSLAFLCLGFLSLFLVDLLDLRKNARRTTRVLGLATATMFLFSALSWFDSAVRSSLVRDMANIDMLLLVGCLVGALLLRVLHRDRLAMQILFSFSPMALAIAFGALVEFGLGEQGPCVKSSLVAVAAILENALTTLVLVREVRRRDKERVVLERQFHQRVVERTDEHLGNLARELHDDLSQQVAALRMRLFGLSRARDDVGLDEAGRSVDELSRSLRRISHRIQPPLLEQGLLGRSLAQLCQEMTNASSVEIAFLSTSDEPPVPRSEGIHLHRIVQEALANAIRHGRPSRVEVILEAETDRLRLVVADDGAGFRPDGIEPGLGLWSIRSRAETLGGTLEISSAPGKGTRIEIEVPLQGRPEDRP
jgi:signal transduction histidine kinase